MSRSSTHSAPTTSTQQHLCDRYPLTPGPRALRLSRVPNSYFTFPSPPRYTLRRDGRPAGVKDIHCKAATCACAHTPPKTRGRFRPIAAQPRLFLTAENRHTTASPYYILQSAYLFEEVYCYLGRCVDLACSPISRVCPRYSNKPKGALDVLLGPLAAFLLASIQWARRGTRCVKTERLCERV